MKYVYDIRRSVQIAHGNTLASVCRPLRVLSYGRLTPLIGLQTLQEACLTHASVVRAACGHCTASRIASQAPMVCHVFDGLKMAFSPEDAVGMSDSSRAMLTLRVTHSIPSLLLPANCPPGAGQCRWPWASKRAR
jgi:hypothetical protein